MAGKFTRVLPSVALLATLALVACAPSAPPAPPAAPAKPAAPAVAPTKAPAAEPTKAPAAAPAATKAPAVTAAPTKAPADAQPAAPKVGSVAKPANYPAKDKTITFIVPYPPGGGTDIPARILAPAMEKILGIPVTVVNKAGAGSQVGITDLAGSKPDGYTFGYVTLPPTISIYLDPDRKAVFNRKSFTPLALYNVDPHAVAVNAESPYKTMKDLLDAAKAKPGQVKASTEGLYGEDHLATMQVQKLSGGQFAMVHFDGGAPANNAVLGDHVDTRMGKVSNFLPHVQSGKMRILAVMDTERSKHYPDVPTMEELGHKLYLYSNRGFAVSAGTPMDAVNYLSDVIGRVATSDEHSKKMDELGFKVKYLNPEQFAKYWDDMEPTVAKLLEEAKAQSTK